VSARLDSVHAGLASEVVALPMNIGGFGSVKEAAMIKVRTAGKREVDGIWPCTECRALASARV
jgi:hypothetical protein